MGTQSKSVLTLTVGASGTISAARFVTTGGAQAGADANTLGVAVTSAVAGDKIPVDVLGTTTVETGAAVSGGATVKADATGRAIAWVTSGARLGVTLEASTGAGQFIEVMLVSNAA